METTCLVVMYNHSFPQNIPRINSIYQSRFPKILHLLPLAEVETPTVISVARSSHNFQGFIFDARHALDTENCDRFLFISDDVFLHPSINSSTVSEYFGLANNDEAFLGDLNSFANLKSFWRHAASARNFKLKSQALDISHALPSFEEAAEKLAELGVFSHSLRRKSLHPSIAAYIYAMFTEAFRKLDGLIRRFLGILGEDEWRHPSSLRLGYPLVWGYSDVFIIPASVAKNFARMCGAFAAAGLFAEVAIPTALALSAKKLQTSSGSNRRGQVLWGRHRKNLDSFNGSLTRLAETFPSNWLFVHPIKLSEWSNE